MVARIRAGRPLQGLVALTFDDGYRGVFESALPVLRDLGLPATVFVIARTPHSGGTIPRSSVRIHSTSEPAGSTTCAGTRRPSSRRSTAPHRNGSPATFSPNGGAP